MIFYCYCYDMGQYCSVYLVSGIVVSFVYGFKQVVDIVVVQCRDKMNVGKINKVQMEIQCFFYLFFDFLVQVILFVDYDNE